MTDRSNASKGVVYVAVGEVYTNMAIASSISLKRHNPDLAVHLFTDQEGIKVESIESYGSIENPHRRSKVDYISASPFDLTLYLDSDTFVLENLHGMFNILERFDLAIAHAHKRNIVATTETWTVQLPYAFPQLNSGVILFRRNELTQQLLSDWARAYHESGFKKDQVTLRQLIWLSEARIYILPPEYNIRFKKYLDIWTEQEAIPKILHFDDMTVFFKSISDKKDK